MAYELQAVIGREESIRSLAAALPGATVVPLPQGLAMVPLVAALRARIDDRWLQRQSRGTALALVSANIAGGTSGGQIASVWKDGEQVLRIAPAELPGTTDSPISRALRLLGAVRSRPSEDEFEALRLGRHRDTEHWLLP